MRLTRQPPPTPHTPPPEERHAMFLGSSARYERGKEDNVRLERTEGTRLGPPSARISGFRLGLWHPLPCWPGLQIRVINRKNRVFNQTLGCEGTGTRAGQFIASGVVWWMVVRYLKNMERILMREDVVVHPSSPSQLCPPGPGCQDRCAPVTTWRLGRDRHVPESRPENPEVY